MSKNTSNSTSIYINIYNIKQYLEIPDLQLRVGHDVGPSLKCLKRNDVQIKDKNMQDVWWGSVGSVHFSPRTLSSALETPVSPRSKQQKDKGVSCDLPCDVALTRNSPNWTSARSLAHQDCSECIVLRSAAPCSTAALVCMLIWCNVKKNALSIPLCFMYTTRLFFFFLQFK